MCAAVVTSGEVVFFFSCRKNCYISGQTLSVDGGSLACSPRQRIAVQQQQVSLQDSSSVEDRQLAQNLDKDYSYSGLDTCVACGLCSISCPVGINTGDLTRLLRGQRNGCFAGDKGFTVPALNASALSHLAEAIPAGCTRGYSNSRTCELGLSHHGGIPYEHLIYLMDRAHTLAGDQQGIKAI